MMALVMAGGSGTRFWPKSREAHPKQLLEIVGNGTMLQNTIRRLQPKIPIEKTFIVCRQIQLEGVISQAPEIPVENIIVEPQGKNTAPCIGLAAVFMEQKFGDETMVVVPADHLISPVEKFIETLSGAEKIVSSENTLITIGVVPTYPATGYGYIQFSSDEIRNGDCSAKRVKTFAEKPTLEIAQKFIESGDFLWNSGIFVWKLSQILNEFEEHLPHLSDGLREIKDHFGKPSRDKVIDRVYQQIKSISIDYGVMEHARNVAVIPANFEWNDLGSWEAVYDLMPKDESLNAVSGTDHFLLDSSGCLIEVEGKAVAAIGIKDLIVVETEDALLLCSKDRSQKVKEIVELLKHKKRTDLL